MQFFRSIGVNRIDDADGTDRFIDPDDISEEPRRLGWSRPGGGWEYVFLWGLIFFAIALRGGGPYSLDRKIGWEL